MATERKISKALLETVQENPHIDKVHFDARGRHWLNVFESKGPIKGLYGHIARKSIADKNGLISIIETPTESTKIVESVDRNDLLMLEPQSDLLVNLNALSPEEQKMIEKMRSKK